jgi:hypothetical protein
MFAIALALGYGLAMAAIFVLFVFVMLATGFAAPDRRLARKFQRLGTVTGLTEAQIVAAVGRPQARSALAGGYLLQLQRTGFHVALRFDAHAVCKGVTHEYRR